MNDVDGAASAGFGGAVLWNSAPRDGCVFDFQEVAMEILASRGRRRQTRRMVFFFTRCRDRARTVSNL